jgi:hypothetical protein
MQIPVITNLPAASANERGAVPPLLSVDSQLKLRGLYEYLDLSRQTLDMIRRDLVLRESGADGFERLHRASERLERFCVEADSWGFNALYEIALSLQMLLLNAGGRIRDNGFWEALQQGLGMLSALLEQCERDFRWRLATADTLDCLNKASGE